MQQFQPFKIIHVEGKNNEVADGLSRLHLYNLMLPKQDNLTDEESRMAEEGEGGDDSALMNSTFCEMVNSVNEAYYSSACKHHKQFHKCNAMPPGERYRNRGGVDGIAPIFMPRDPDEKLLEKLLAESEPLADVELRCAPDAVAHSSAVAAEVSTDPPFDAKTSTYVECQSNDIDLRDSRKKMAGCFPNRRMIERARDYSHSSVSTAWARVQRICGIAPGARGAVSREEVRRYVEACPVFQKFKPARERIERAAGSIRQRPFSQFSFDVVVLLEPDANGFRYILTVVDNFSGAVELFPLSRASAEALELLSDTASCFLTAGNQSRKSAYKEPKKYFGVLAGNEITHNLDVVTVSIDSDGIETVETIS
jgi:hypothetical protein